MIEYQQSPWYRQFWPWFLISIPLASVIAGIAMIIIAVDGADDMVVDDYYKEGLTINRRLEKLIAAKELGIQADLHLIGNKLSLKIFFNKATQDIDKYTDSSPLKQLEDNLKLQFHHATIEERDFELILQETTSGNYFALLNPEQQAVIAAKWHIQLLPFSGNWQLAGSWVLPSELPLKMGD